MRGAMHVDGPDEHASGPHGVINVVDAIRSQQPDHLISLVEITNRMGCSLTTAKRYRDTHPKFPPLVMIGRLRRYSEHGFLRFLEALQKETEAAEAAKDKPRLRRLK